MVNPFRVRSSIARVGVLVSFTASFNVLFATRFIIAAGCHCG